MWEQQEQEQPPRLGKRKHTRGESGPVDLEGCSRCQHGRSHGGLDCDLGCCLVSVDVKKVLEQTVTLFISDGSSS